QEGMAGEAGAARHAADVPRGRIDGIGLAASAPERAEVGDRARLPGVAVVVLVARHRADDGAVVGDARGRGVAQAGQQHAMAVMPAHGLRAVLADDVAGAGYGLRRRGGAAGLQRRPGAVLVDVRLLRAGGRADDGAVAVDGERLLRRPEIDDVV